MQKVILVTGCAGFIGYHLCCKLLKNDFFVVGLDNINSYYDVKLKKQRIKNLEQLSINKNNSFVFIKENIENKENLENIFNQYKFEIVVNLAAQAGVRYSLINPDVYITSNILGFSCLLEYCKKFEVKNLIYASSSSVYGGNTKIPFNENDSVNHPVSLYAATKRTNELMAHTYSHLYGIPTTGLRLFTVYGPWGRPDMAPMLFANGIISKEKIRINNNGDMSRDFTFIDDVIEIIFRLLFKPATSFNNFDKNKPEASLSWAPHRIFNIGNSKSINLMDFIKALENELGVNSIKEFAPMPNGDVKDTFANTDAIESWVGFKPNTSIEYGVKKFINWYKSYYKI